MYIWYFDEFWYGSTAVSIPNEYQTLIYVVLTGYQLDQSVEVAHQHC